MLSLQSEEFAKAPGLSAADGDFSLLLVVHAQLIGTLEPGDNFLNVIDIYQVGPVCPPEEVGIKAVQELFQSAAVRLAFHAVGPAGRYRDDAVLNRRMADIFLIDQKQTSSSLQQNLRCLRLL